MMLVIVGALAPLCAGFAGVSVGTAVHASRYTAARMPSIALCASPAVAQPPLETECDFDHGPLAAALAGGDLLEADSITRRALIELAGEQAVLRDFVYFTEVKKIPYKDMATIDALWRAYTGDKQGYSVQSKILRSPKVAGDLPTMYTRIGWSKEGGTLLRWTPDDGNEFIYDNEKAPAGHLPLTSTLRGTRLLKELMEHPAIVDASKTLK